MTPLHQLTATEIVSATTAGELTCEAVAQACLDHIAKREPQVHAWQYLDPAQVIAQARALDRRGSKGPLHGVPVGMKDIIDTADMPTEYGSPIYRGHRPASDAACVALTRRAGGLIMGKTVTTEFANRHPGKTVNPRDPQRTPGGSSSGSGAAVGDDMVPLAVGTQTTASTLRPASFNGCFGFRPTWGDLRLVGVKEAAGSLDTLGLISRSVEDIALYRDVLLGISPQPIPADAGTPPRIGFCRTQFWKECEPHTQKLLEQCAARLAKAGARVDEVVLPKEFERVEDVHLRISSFEFSRNFSWEIDNHWNEISETLRNNRLKHGLACTFEKYREARECAAHCRGLLDHVFADHDVLLAPSASGEAPVGLNSTGNASFCTLWTTMHVPAMTLPLFTGPAGLPIGAQIIARRGADRHLFQAARWIWRTMSA
jgi:Asp-tRNA(Asn)/Glu-tRNA(Gln) amidotransferase A subunit family amidase